MTQDQLVITVSLSQQDVVTVAAIVYDCARVMRLRLGTPKEHPPLWDFASAEARHDTEVIVRRIASGKMRSGGEIHDQWRDDQYRIGWRYGATPDLEHMRSPYIVEFAALPPETQARYHLVYAVATNVLANMALIAAGRLAAQTPH